MELLNIILVIASLLPFSASDRQGYSHAYHIFICVFHFFLVHFQSFTINT